MKEMNTNRCRHCGRQLEPVTVRWPELNLRCKCGQRLPMCRRAID
jgi:hypothetical protein